MLENVAAKEHAFPFDRNKLNSQQYESLDDPDAVEYGNLCGDCLKPANQGLVDGFQADLSSSRQRHDGNSSA